MTQLTYLEHMEKLTDEAEIMDVIEENGKTSIVLDKTIFYPQGGGQPFDTGKIISETGEFTVEQTRYFEGIVKHNGTVKSGSVNSGDKVKLEVDPERRLLNARLHSGGHLVDMGIYEFKPEWVPAKGYHFPEGPYVEYEGSISEDEKEELKTKLETFFVLKISESIPVTIKFVEKNDIADYCRHVPDNIPEGKPTRVVLFGDFGVPCGGTHIENLIKLKKATIRKIKQEKDMVRVSYDVER